MHSLLCVASGREIASLGDDSSELCWKAYAHHNGSSDVDRLLIEEQIKVRSISQCNQRISSANSNNSVKVAYGWCLMIKPGR